MPSKIQIESTIQSPAIVEKILVNNNETLIQKIYLKITLINNLLQ